MVEGYSEDIGQPHYNHFSKMTSLFYIYEMHLLVSHSGLRSVILFLLGKNSLFHSKRIYL